MDLSATTSTGFGGSEIWKTHSAEGEDQLSTWGRSCGHPEGVEGWFPGTDLAYLGSDTILSHSRKVTCWTISHVRSLEERMDDVERWLVKKEKEREPQSQQRNQQFPAASDFNQDISDSNVPSRGPIVHKSSFSEIAVRSMTTSPTHAYPTAGGKEPTSPPTIAPLAPTSTGSRTRLPYPTGD